jgi:2-methylcitrate dehydratase PrpD
MRRRDFGKASLGLVSSTILSSFPTSARASTCPEFVHAKGVTSHVGQFVTAANYDELPTELIALGKKSILDGLGLALAGSREKTALIARRYIRSLGIENGTAVIAGTAEKTPPPFAALLNGICIHADDFDDTQLASEKNRVYGLLTHPTVSVLSAVLALLEPKKISGKDFTLAYHLGVEVECKIAEAISPRSYEDGFHSTGTCGPFGSAAACAKLRDFNLSETLTLLGLVASQSAGLRENFGTMTKPFHAGHAAQIGVMSADLVALGWTASGQILEADGGFFHAYGGSYDPEAILNRLGKPWTFVSPGVSLKPFPSGSLTHPAMTELMRLIDANNIQARQVDRVDVGANRYMTTTLLYHQPETGLEAKFSMEFCIAILLLERKAGLREFTDEVVRRPDVQAMMHKVDFHVDPIADRAGYDKMTSRLRIHLKDGRVITGEAQFAKGSPSNPMSFEETADKFRGCAEYADWPTAKSEKIIEFVRELERQPDASVILTLLSAESE